MIKIDKNVPIPSISGILGRPSKYPFSEMSVGDSLKVSLKNKHNVFYSAKSWAIKNNKKAEFITRSYDKFARIWRVK